jgi:hypothetical protein
MDYERSADDLLRVLSSIESAENNIENYTS